MQNSNSERSQVLAIAPASKGFGFVFMRDRFTLLDWGTRSVKKADKNEKCIIKVEKLIKRHQPEHLVLPDVFEKGARRRERTQALVRRLALLAKRKGIAVQLISKQQLHSFFLGGRPGTKHEIAMGVAGRLPDELGDLLPPERQLWMSENHYSKLFDAAALGLASFRQPEN